MPHQDTSDSTKAEAARTDDAVAFVIDDAAVLEATMATMQGDAK
ncbi:MAG TPA: hypothetical protein VHP58_03580 [Alphaproteobacteria bacterium]|nr:hypothetical protein [Alphaproteobacteria bacterium]